MRRSLVVSLLDQGVLSGFNLLLSFALIRFADPSGFGAFVFAATLLLVAGSLQNALILTPLGVIVPGETGFPRAVTLATLGGADRLFRLAAAGLGAALLALHAAEPAYLAAGAALIYSGLWRETHRAVFAATDRIGRCLALDASAVGLGALFTVAAWAVLAPRDAVLVGLSLGNALAVLIVGRGALPAETGIDLARAGYRRFWDQARWSLLGAGTTEAQYRAYVFMVEAFRGGGALGTIQAGRVLMGPLNLFASAWGRVARPAMARHLAACNVGAADRVLRDGLLILVAVMAVYFVALVVAWPLAETHVFRGRYPGIALLCALWGIYTVVQVTQICIGYYVQAAHLFRPLSFVSVAAASVTIILLCGLAFDLPLAWAIIAATVGEAIALVWLIVLWRLARRSGRPGGNARAIGPTPEEPAPDLDPPRPASPAMAPAVALRAAGLAERVEALRARRAVAPALAANAPASAMPAPAVAPIRQSMPAPTPYPNALRHWDPRSGFQRAAESLAAWIPALVLAYAYLIWPLLFGEPVDRIDNYLNPNAGLKADNNWLNQVYFPPLLLLALVSWLTVARRRLGDLARAPILAILALIVWAGFTALWAIDPETTIRRLALQVIIVATVVFSVAALRDPLDALRRAFWLSVLVVAVNVVAVATMPPGPLGYEGIYPQKNSLGSAMALAMLLCLFRVGDGNPFTRLMALGTVIVAGALLLLSQSKTSLALILLTPMFLIASLFVARYLRISAAVTVFGLVFTLYLLYEVGAQGLVFGFFDVTGRLFGDPTITNRTDIWAFALSAISDRPWLGYGFETFWQIGPGSPSAHAPGFIAKMPHAHNGYLDAVLQGGIPQLLLLLGTIAVALHAAAAHVDRDPGRAVATLSIVLFVTFFNLFETTWFRGFNHTHIAVLIAIVVAALPPLGARNPVRRPTPSRGVPVRLAGGSPQGFAR
ncbi:MAG: O-antigen ligase family protein [Hyphomicrobiaceae bacterium]|nr:O-antigen ligase family protein [Hyphomicrobiaceae bacterium]